METLVFFGVINLC